MFFCYTVTALLFSIECIDGIPEHKLCPEGLLFNPNVRFAYPCEYPAGVNCDGRHFTAFLGLRCPSDPNDENRLYKFEFYASPYDCQRYFVCVNGRPRLQVCEEGKAFSQLENTCLPAHNVSGCEPLGLPHEKKKVPLIGTVIEGES